MRRTRVDFIGAVRGGRTTQSRATSRSPLTVWLLGLSVWAAASGANARTWIVTADGTGDTATIQQAVVASAPSDSILVGPGNYDENIDTGDKRLTLIGQLGATATVIDGGRRGSVIRLTGGGCVEGLTVQQGQAPLGGGVYVEGSGPTTIRHSIIQENVAGAAIDEGSGGGIYLDVSTEAAVIENNVIRQNSAGDSGGGIYERGGFDVRNIIRQNTIAENTCFVAGAGLSTFRARIAENLLVTNHSDHFAGGIDVRSDGDAEIEKNTIVANTTMNPIIHGAGIHTAGPARITNNIVAFNRYAGSFGLRTGVGVYCTFGVASSSSVMCNDSWGNDVDEIINCAPVDASNLSLDPLFCDASRGLYTLSGNSPCVPNASSSCGLIGAFGPGCGTTSVQERSWGEIKRLYR